jgi:xylulokinase
MSATQAFFGLDVGTSSTKGVLVDVGGRVLRTAVREHDVDRPHDGFVEMDSQIWWSEFLSIADELTGDNSFEIEAIGVSGMGPCVLITDERGHALRPAILYGVDTRATSQISSLSASLGDENILARCGSVLTSQAVGPKLAWIADEEPAIWARARRLFMPSSFLSFKLTGSYVLDYHSASQCTPLFDIEAQSWYAPWVEVIAPDIDFPELAWPGEHAGTTLTTISGIRAGTPVIVGTIDAWTESVSVGAVETGDLMLMYGTTLFMIATVADSLRTPSMWSTIGAFPGTRNLAGGLATSGAITSWLRDLFGGPPFADLIREAEWSGPGARGLLMLPYFAGERTPIMDPKARGVIAGLTLAHSRGDLYRAALEATGFAVRHNVAAMTEAGAHIDRVIAVGGGTQSALWPQIVSDVTGLTQLLPEKTIGACYGAAFLAARLLADVSIREWNPIVDRAEPNPDVARYYGRNFELYRELYLDTASLVHHLANGDAHEGASATQI